MGILRRLPGDFEKTRRATFWRSLKTQVQYLGEPPRADQKETIEFVCRAVADASPPWLCDLYRDCVEGGRDWRFDPLSSSRAERREALSRSLFWTILDAAERGDPGWPDREPLDDIEEENSLDLLWELIR